MLIKFIRDVAAPIYYIAGPPSLVAAMRASLVGARISEHSIRAEEFAGY